MREWTPSSVTNNAFEFLITDLETALTFLDVAASTDKRHIRKRNHANARHAYDTVLRLMQHLSLNDTQQKELAKRLDLLKSRLQKVGEKF